ncbi:MAG: TetR family transcriptional regulator [Tetrasphaera sp.]|nr:TetR family transcriptional regulator [Tetrasphaera sp.]
MARIAEARTAAEPSSLEQKERRSRIIRSAALLATESEFDQVQMQDVAREAKVAIATLYRYFPSKTHLFVALLRRQIGRLTEVMPDPEDGASPIDAVSELLVAAQRQLLERPKFASAIIGAVNVANAETVTDAAVIDRAFYELILRVAGIERATDEDTRAVRLLVQCWFGLLTTTLNGRLDPAVAEMDLRRACQLLLVDLSSTH